MSRPAKPRYVCELPEYSMFGPKGQRARNLEKVVMTIDEFETIRLIDYEGMNQEEAAKQMNVARTTIQRIYVLARQKLADSLINGKVILFEGGEYILCKDDCDNCPKPASYRRRGHRKHEQ
jgi:uncharacterized protein